jgi:hypothetical protein
VTLSSGADQQLEVVIDDKPGIISGTATDGDKPAAQAVVRLFSSSSLPMDAQTLAICTEDSSSQALSPANTGF